MTVNITDRSDAIELADRLASGYEDLNKIEEKIASLETDNKRDMDMIKSANPVAHEYFKPFFYVSIAAFAIVMFYVPIFAFYYRGLGYQKYMCNLLYLVPFGVVAVIHFVGGLISRGIRAAKNKKMTEDEEYRMHKISERKADIWELEDKQMAVKKELDKFNELIPAGMRNKRYMVRIRTLLANNKAGTLEEAIQKCAELD